MIRFGPFQHSCKDQIESHDLEVFLECRPIQLLTNS